MTKRTKPLRAEILEYKQPKTATGGSGASGGGTGFYAGENMTCRILRAERVGYAVLVPKCDLVGVLATTQHFIPDEEVSAQFVCMSKGTMFLQCGYGPKNTSPEVSIET
jgi:hypothetical protein